MKPVAVLCFPGTQCDQDVKAVFDLLNKPVKWIWHKDQFSYRDYSSFILAGGFSYGDYLRAGALAAHSQATREIHSAALAGWPVLGICNGFQILCEMGLLTGTLRLNQNCRFISKWIDLELCNPCEMWGGDKKKNICIPMAHKEGSFYVSKEQLRGLENESQIWWRYKKNPNGSVEDIAGVMNKKRNVAGLMPHPERAVANWMGSEQGLSFFQN